MVSLKIQSNPRGPRGSPWLLLDLWSVGALLAESRPTPVPIHLTPWCLVSMLLSEGKAFCNSGFKLICSLSGYILAVFSLCCLLQLCGDTKGKKAKCCQLSVTLKGFYSLIL